MIKTLSKLKRAEHEGYVRPTSVEQIIPITQVWDDGIIPSGKNKYAKTYQITDINYAVASKDDKEALFLEYSELLNSFDSGATTKVTVAMRKLDAQDFEQNILIPYQDDSLDEYRREHNNMLLNKAQHTNSMVREMFITVTVVRKSINDARNYFNRATSEISGHLARLGSKCSELTDEDKLHILHDFFRAGHESEFFYDRKDSARKGHSFKDSIVPESLEAESGYFKMGERFGRVLYLKDYASYIKDSFLTELTDMDKSLMLSIDVIPVPTDEAVREVENRLLGVETNITNWTRKQNQNLRQHPRRTRFGYRSHPHNTARKHLCSLAVCKYQQLDGLMTAFPIGFARLMPCAHSPPKVWPCSCRFACRRLWTPAVSTSVKMHFPKTSSSTTSHVS